MKPEVVTPSHRDSLRVATYNVHGCLGVDGRRSEERIAEVIDSLNVDVVGLQELDLNRARSGHADQAEILARRLRWAHVFHPAMQVASEQYGDAILSRFPMTLRRAAPLPGEAPWYCRETRGAIWVEVETSIGVIQVFNAHFGLGRFERIAQARALTGPDWLLSAKESAVVLGDFNSLPSSKAFRLLCGRLKDSRSFFPRRPNLRTFPTHRPIFGIDHILVSDDMRVDDVSVIITPATRRASDHFPLVASIRRERKG